MTSSTLPSRSAMPMPMAAPSNTARKRASVACSACSASLRAASAERAMASCSARVRSRSAWAKPAARACWSRAQRALPSSAGPVVRAAVQHQVRVDDAERAAEGVGVGAVRRRPARPRPGARARRRSAARAAPRSTPVASGSRCCSNSARVRDVAVAGKIARLQIVANRLSLSSRPSGASAPVSPLRATGTIHALRPTPAKPEKAYGSSCLDVGLSGRQSGSGHQAGLDHLEAVEEPRGLLTRCASPGGCGCPCRRRPCRPPAPAGAGCPRTRRG